MTQDWTDDADDTRQLAMLELTRVDQSEGDKRQDARVRPNVGVVPACPDGATQWYGGTDDSRFPDIQRDDNEDPRRPAG